MNGISNYIKNNAEEIIKRMEEEISKLTKKEWVRISEKHGISSAKKTNVFKGYQEKPSLEFIWDISQALMKPINYFLFGEINQNAIFFEVPIIDTVLSEDKTLIYMDKKYRICNDDYLRYLENPYDLVCMKQNGDSMQNTIMKNNCILINRAQKKIMDGNIFSFAYKDNLHIQTKRLSFTKDEILIISDNKNYDNYFVKEKDLTIIGLVICTFQILI